MKRCNRCHKLKNMDDFHHYAVSPDGHSPRCKQCASEAYKVYTKTKRRYNHITSIEVPECTRGMKLSEVLPTLIMISTSGAKYTDEILSDAIRNIKESLS